MTEQLQLPVTDRILWTDWQCVLHWMKSHKPLPVFVQNRPKERTSHKDIKFTYVTTTQNPADLATRGVSTEELVNNQLSWHGPSWLGDQKTKWPSWDFQQIDKNTLEKMAKQPAGPQIMYETSAPIEMDRKKDHSDKPVAPFELNENNYSSLTRLLRVTAWALRFIRRHVQNSSFASEIKAIKNNTRNNLRSQLGLRIDDNRILRCHCRLIRENLPESTFYPKLLRVITLSYTGLDYLGPLYVKVNNESATHKVWVCLFTCLAVRAVHLEIIDDMSAEQFLLCLRGIYHQAWQAKRDYIGQCLTIQVSQVHC